MTILFLSPDPTVMVIPTHCAYQCLDNKNRPGQVQYTSDGVSPDLAVMVTPAHFAYCTVDNKNRPVQVL